MAITTKKNITIEEAMALPVNEAIELWKTLPAPGINEMSGEYDGFLHHGGDETVKEARAAYYLDESSEKGRWLGKAFKKGPGGKGEGHNIFRKTGNIMVRVSRFATEVGDSPLDGKPAFILSYRVFNNSAAQVDFVDEIRKLGDGLYLGIYTANQVMQPMLPEMRGLPHRAGPEIFGLKGPNGPWVGVDDESLELKS